MGRTGQQKVSLLGPLLRSIIRTNDYRISSCLDIQLETLIGERQTIEQYLTPWSSEVK